MATYKQIPVQVENPFDEFGKLIGIPRFPLESNLSYRTRMLNAASNWGSSTKQGLINGICSELGLRVYNTDNRSFYFLSYPPLLVHPNTGAALSFLVSVNGTIYSDYESSGTTLQSYKLWKLNDGTPSRILEFKEIPDTNSHIKIQYYRLEDGIPHLFTDESVGIDDTRFIGMSGETPGSQDIEIYELTDSDFQNTYLLDSLGLPNKTFNAIVDELYNVHPILWGDWVWGKTFWDVADDDIAGIEHLPTIFDLPRTGLASSDFESGIGYGTDCSPISIIPELNDRQRIRLSPGYLYIRDQEYYLFASKSTCVSGDFFATQGPIIVTSDPGGDEHYSTPFGKTWQKDSTNKLRQAVELSGDYVYIPSTETDPADPYFYVDISGQMSFSGSYTIADITVEYDAGEYYIADIDFNPVNSFNRANKMIGITSYPISAEYLTISYIDLYSKRGDSATYDALDTTGSDVYPDQDISIRLDVTDWRGAPVTQPDTFVRIAANYNNSRISTVDKYLYRDGGAFHTFASLADRTATSAKDIIISGQVWQGGSNTGVTAEINIPLGVPK